MFHAAQDEVVPYYDAVNTTKQWCAAGANIDFVTGIGGISIPFLGSVIVGHLATSYVAVDGAQFWLSLRMNGITPPTGCSWNTQDYTPPGTYTANSGTPSPSPTHGTGI